MHKHDESAAHARNMLAEAATALRCKLQSGQRRGPSRSSSSRRAVVANAAVAQAARGGGMAAHCGGGNGATAAEDTRVP